MKRRNSYPGTCDVCFCQVKAGQGYATRKPGGWGLRHADCHPKADGATGVIQIEADHFSAGVLTRSGRVVEAAPIVRYMQGWAVERVMGYCDKKGWKHKEVAR